MRRHQGAKVKHFDFSDMIYHKFSHGALSHALNGENVNVMLELSFHRCIAEKIYTIGLEYWLSEWVGVGAALTFSWLITHRGA